MTSTLGVTSALGVAPTSASFSGAESSDEAQLGRILTEWICAAIWETRAHLARFFLPAGIGVSPWSEMVEETHIYIYLYLY